VFFLFYLNPACEYLQNLGSKNTASIQTRIDDNILLCSTNSNACNEQRGHKMSRIFSIVFFSFFVFFQSAIQPVHAGQASLIFDIDGDNDVRPLTDGLLLLRYQFGFRFL